MLIAVNYHYVRPAFDAPYPGIHGIIPDKLESQLRELGTAGQFVSGGELRAAVRGETRLPERAFVVTFDDGLREQYECAWPVLERLGIPAIFFVNTRPIAEKKVSSVHKIHLLRAHVSPEEFLERLGRAARERGVRLDVESIGDDAIKHYKYDEPQAARLKFLLNMSLSADDRDALIDILFDEIFAGREAELSAQLYMSTKQVAELGHAGAIGTHAHEHLPLGLLDDAAAARQIDASVAELLRWTGRAPFALSYPYGSREASSPAAAAAAARLGIEFAFTTERAANRDLRSPLHLARFDNNDLPGGKASAWSIDNLFDSVPLRSWYT